MIKNRMIRSAAFMLGAGVAMCSMTDDATAQGCGYGGYGGYGGGVSIRSGYGGYGFSGFGRRTRGYRSVYRRPAIWHDTSHFDYHRGQLVPHGNHFDYQPGNYHLHRTGHFHH